MFSPLTKQLIDAFRGLPGIGPKSAQRLTYQLLADSGKEKAHLLSDALKQAALSVAHCQQCRQFTEETICAICKNSKRDHSLLCVVENPSDMIALEQTHAFHGVYFVLHGHLSPLDGVTPDDLHIPQLLSRLQNESIREIILATNPTVEGKATAQYIAGRIDANKISCTRIAHGVPMGGELEYLDGSTLSHAFYSRRPVE
ncbi:MAG: recombination protein RecR [Gammaproteobacteria bacterium RIFCSPLOWO2_02_FULL_42_14]|nr:MAG: recombination protein RecR [Gammaproteobacteria bacterium RIFCSPHIGHO2_02_FULL_42_43]OGT27387.1 MAG: recombination protein RecR [Gammaproteobacteria bacterium RIFCSPHIGHO2_01_FULL_42_8]OGT52298.1 MAG: recombination protein RecR [Gammaproteobacteria bacterium RIFCSPHIGHO2_12_FULL_41_25]OGT61910.1 MAG: recombination protein RecR [Gammaproteobacteria bacterium RIFCSPLOWO2_02_FULL_42_14]OGT86379.1 MAG: recombination protein RecR [Gammaproteobacteria bacterium RIFCSPLOWO2_12_FULL_42_18]